MQKQLAVLDAPLLQLSMLDRVDVRTACNHQLIFGTAGSGKSSFPRQRRSRPQSAPSQQQDRVIDL